MPDFGFPKWSFHLVDQAFIHNIIKKWRQLKWYLVSPALFTRQLKSKPKKDSMQLMDSLDIPNEIKNIFSALQKAGFEAAAVGGCSRDLLLGRIAQDWDVATNASPQQIQEIFPQNFYENKFGTVTVQTGSSEASLANVEITPYRTESSYADYRHPDQVRWAKTLQEDLSRRDFTVNAIAIRPMSGVKNKYEIVDLFDGQKDLKNKVIRAVGDPQERFNEDALRMVRALRLASILGFSLDDKTRVAITKNADLLRKVSAERLRDEFLKMLGGDNSGEGIELMRQCGILPYILPELLEGYRVGQNKHHKYDVYEHSLKSLEYADKKKFPILVKLASLLHDIGKPKSKRGEGIDSTFYGHEVIGAKMARRAMERLKFSKAQSQKVEVLVRYHLFYYNAGEVTENSVRRLIRNVGMENVEDLLLVRQADRIGSGCPKAEPYKLRHLRYIIDKVSHDPISPKMLKVNGHDLMALLNIPPGPKIGQILDVLLEKVIDAPLLNEKEKLENLAKELNLKSEKDLLEMRRKANESIEKISAEEDLKNKRKYKV